MSSRIDKTVLHGAGSSRSTARWCAALLLGCSSAATADNIQLASLTDLSLEELANIEITSVSKRPEPLSAAPASIYVITADSIRRAGVRTLPEALRLAPNLQVARVASNSYAISARGFNNSNGLANKLLVLIDGRTIYSPVLSGVLWDMQDVMLEDIDRIEVISGPGGTLWGLNAVNGVINIITRQSSETQGGLYAQGAGNNDAGAAMRYGGTLGDNGHFRVYGKLQEIDNTVNENGDEQPNSWQRGQFGFRTDWRNDGITYTVQGDTYKGETEDRGAPYGRVKIAGTNLLARMTSILDDGSTLRLQSYFDRTERDDLQLFQGDADIFDLEFQHSIPISRHTLLWGAGYRQSHDDIPPSAQPIVISFDPQKETLTWHNIFVQGDFSMTDSLDLSAGIKFEENDYTGWEEMPSLRLAWQITQRQLWWTSASRAIRAPARLDRDFHFSFVVPPFIDVTLIDGGPDFESEIADVYEIGYRAQPAEDVSFSITAFQTRYDKLRSGEPAPNAQIQNDIYGIVNGVEGWGNLQANSDWRLSAGFSTLTKHLRLRAGSPDPEGPSALGNDPEWHWQLRSAHELGANQQLDVLIRHSGPLPDPEVPAYTAVDARWGWLLNAETEISLTLENIFDNLHAEFEEPGSRSEFERTAYFKVVWRQ